MFTNRQLAILQVVVGAIAAIVAAFLALHQLPTVDFLLLLALVLVSAGVFSIARRRIWRSAIPEIARDVLDGSRVPRHEKLIHQLSSYSCRVVSERSELNKLNRLVHKYFGDHTPPDETVICIETKNPRSNLVMYDERNECVGVASCWALTERAARLLSRGDLLESDINHSHVLSDNENASWVYLPCIICERRGGKGALKLFACFLDFLDAEFLSGQRIVRFITIAYSSDGDKLALTFGNIVRSRAVDFYGDRRTLRVHKLSKREIRLLKERVISRITEYNTTDLLGAIFDWRH